MYKMILGVLSIETLPCDLSSHKLAPHFLYKTGLNVRIKHLRRLPFVRFQLLMTGHIMCPTLEQKFESKVGTNWRFYHFCSFWFL